MDKDETGTGTEETGKDPDESVAGLRSALVDERKQKHGLEQENAQLRGQVGQLQQPQQPQQPAPVQEFSRAELDAAVQQGTITQAAAEAIYEGQVTRRIEQSVTNNMSAHQLVNAVGLELERYKRAVPDLKDRTSKSFQAVASEYNYLMRLGQPNNLITQLTAVRSKLGPIDQLERVQARDRRETFQEGGGEDQSDDTGVTRNKDGAPRGLSRREREHYEKHMGPNKMYKNWNDVAAELKHANPELRKKHGARIE